MNPVTQYWVKIITSAVAGVLIVLNYTNPPIFTFPSSFMAVLLGALVVGFGWSALQGGQAVMFEREVTIQRDIVEELTKTEKPAK